MTTDRKSKCCGVKLTIFTDVEEGTSWYLCSKCNEACDVAGGKWRSGNLDELNQNYVRTGDQPMPEEGKLTTGEKSEGYPEVFETFCEKHKIKYKYELNAICELYKPQGWWALNQADQELIIKLIARLKNERD